MWALKYWGRVWGARYWDKSGFGDPPVAPTRLAVFATFHITPRINATFAMNEEPEP